MPLPNAPPTSANDPFRFANISQTSFVTDSEPTTNETASDLPGPGRLLGNFYSRSGRVLLSGANAVASRIRRRQRSDQQDLIPPGFANTPSALRPAPSETGRSVYSAVSSTNNTSSDLTGAGRVLGNAYSAGGRYLEKHIGRLAVRVGRGPDACYRRIESILSRNHFSESQKLAAAAHRDVKQLFELRRSNPRLVKETKRLMRYARSYVPTTQRSALQHLATLAIEDPYMRTLFNVLDLPDILDKLKERELNRHATGINLFAPLCLKAIACLSSTNEVNIIVRRFRADGDDATEFFDALQHLWRHLSDPEQSFLVLRHIRRMFVLSSRGASVLAFGFLSLLIEKLAQLAYSLPHIVEWVCLDDICEASLFSYLSYVYHGAVREFENIARWNQIIVTILRNAHHFPKTVAYLTDQTDIDALLDQSRYTSILSQEAQIALSDGTRIDPLRFHSASVCSQIVYDAHYEDEDVHFGNKQICKSDCIQEMVRNYSNRSLALLWKNLSVEPDAVTSEILAERAGGWCRIFELSRVPRSRLLRNLCRRLALFLTSSDREIYSHATRRIRLVLQLDRYCNKAMVKALKDIPPGLIPGDVAEIARSSPSVLSLDQKLDSGEFFSWMMRHQTAEGSHVHIRKKLIPFSTKNPCARCLMLQSEDPASNGPPPETDVLRAAIRQLMFLEVRPGTGLSVSKHLPVLAGVNEAGEKEYIAAVIVPIQRDFEDPLAVEWTSVANGATTATFNDDEGNICTTDHFWVLVLRYDTTPDVEQAVRCVGGIDITGECRWQRL